MARFHYYLDIVLEAPLLLGVVLTGTVLLLQTQPDAALWVKVAAGLGAVVSNVVCVVVVIRRDRAAVRDGDLGALRDCRAGCSALRSRACRSACSRSTSAVIVPAGGEAAGTAG